MSLIRIFTPAVLVVTILIVISSTPALAVEHATAGVITRVDHAAKNIAIKTADGTEEIFKFTGRTAVHTADGAKAVAAGAYFTGKEGTHVVVHYTEEGAEKTAVAVDDFGKEAMKVGRGVVTEADKAGHTVKVKTDDGSEATYHVAKDAAVETEHGVVRGTEFAATNGEKVTVHYTEEAGQRIAHFIRRM
jgi:hypothetical protein